MADQFGDLGHYSVSERPQPVWLAGNCINHSTHSGFGIPPRTVLRLVPPCANFERRKPVSEARGVGYNPEAIPPVRRVNGVSRDTVPFRIIPERAEGPEHSPQSSRAKDWAIFKDDKPWPYIGDEADNLTPKPTFGPVRSCHPPDEADILAGEPAADDINGNSICSKSSCCEFSDVMVARHLRPVFRQNAAGKILNLAKRYSLEPASALKPQRKAPDARKQIEHTQFTHCPALSERGRGPA